MIDYTNKDYEAFRQMMIEGLQIRMPEYTDLRQSDAGIVILECLAQGLDIISYYQDVYANETFLTTQEQRENALKWAYMLDYYPRFSTPSIFRQVFVLTAPQATDTVIPAWTVLKTVGSVVEPEIFFETVHDHVIPAGKWGDEQEDGEYLYMTDVVQGQSVNNELLGTSDGTLNQVFTLVYSSAYIDDLLVVVNEGSGFEKWDRVDNFIDSGSNSKHYIVRPTDNDLTEIVFGNGLFGKIPAIFTNGIYAYYRVGVGERGNIGANKITVLDTNIAIVGRTFNPYLPLRYGQDKESLEEIKMYAPVAYRTRWGALTLQDFAEVTRMNFQEIIFAIALNDDTEVDDLNLYYLLRDGKSVDDDDFKQRIWNFFDETRGGRKIVGAKEIHIWDAVIVPLDLESVLVVHERFSRSAVEEQINIFMENVFARGNYDFGKDLSLTQLAAAVMRPENAIEGIKSFKFIGDDDIIEAKSQEIFSLNSFSIDSYGGVD